MLGWKPQKPTELKLDGEKVICYQLELAKQLAKVSTECSSHDQDESERSANKCCYFIAMHY